MRASRLAFVCLQCRLVGAPRTTRTTTSGLFLLQSSATRRSSSLTSNSDPTTTTATITPTPTTTTPPQRPTTAPRPNIDIKHIRHNEALHEQNCLERNYKTQSSYPSRINAVFEQYQTRQREGKGLRERGNALRRQISNPATTQNEGEERTRSGIGSKAIKGEGGLDTVEMPIESTTNRVEHLDAIKTMTREELIEEARVLKQQISVIEEDEDRLQAEMADLALAIPNLTSAETPRGHEARVLSYINIHHIDDSASSSRIWRSHVDIGSELGILDFSASGTTSGWGWYFLVDEGAQLEQALISYALDTILRSDNRGWHQVAPPSIVYSHIASACGYQPRDQNNEQQIYALAQTASDASRGRPELSLAGTAEIPFAGMRADSVLSETADIPRKVVGVSRCYRAEAGARGVDTKGLYRVHEFNKVEMFAWTHPSLSAATDVFDEMLDLQTEILEGLGLHCRVLEMPSTDLGASAFRKCDIEAFFPSRRTHKDSGGWGEVTSTSICTDYQTRRLATRLRLDSSSSSSPRPPPSPSSTAKYPSSNHGIDDTKTAGITTGKMTYPWTVNGTAMAVPRVLAAVLENGWDDKEMTVAIPEVLRPWMGGREKIGLKRQRK